MFGERFGEEAEGGKGDLRGLSVLLVGEVATAGRDRLAAVTAEAAVGKNRSAGQVWDTLKDELGGEEEGCLVCLRKLSLEAFLRQFLTREDWGLCRTC